MSYPPSPPWVEASREPALQVPPGRRDSRLPYLLVGLTFLTTMLAGGGFAGYDPLSAFVAGFRGGLGPLLVTLAATAWAGLPYAITVMLFFFAHEMGHYVACRRYGVDCTLPYFIPGPPPLPFGTLGAVIRIRSAIPSRKALFDIGIAGPLAGFVVALPLLVIGTLAADTVPRGPLPSGGVVFVYGDSLLSWGLIRLLRPDAAGMELLVNPVFMAGWLGMLATAMNLIPAGQLDGGHVVYALAPRWHRAVGLAAGGFLLGLVTMRGLHHHELSAWVLWTLVVFVFGRHHPPVPNWDRELGARRALLAGCVLLILLISFIPVPLQELR